MPLILVIDSNIWLAEQMLRHSSGSALRFFLRTSGARVAVPEVVRREVTLHLARELKEGSQAMRRSHERLLRLVGSLRELVLPPDHELDMVAQAAFESARIDAFDVPLSIESARASFDKCISRQPPSAPKDQQFKDGVVWADCVRLAAENPVLLVTADKGFYKNRAYENGLASNLAAEAQATQHGVTIVHELSAVLQRVRADVTIDYAHLSQEYLAKFRQGIDQWVSLQGFVLGELLVGTHRLFATDDPASAYLEFELSYRCVHPDQREGTLVVRGEGTYSPTASLLGELQQRGEEFHFDGVDGQRTTVRSIHAVGSITLGHRIVRHEVRALLDGGDS